VSHVRDVRRLRALEMHGALVVATVTSVSRGRTRASASASASETETLRYEYVVDGTRHTGSARWPRVPYGAGEAVVVYYLPESPSSSRPGALLSDEAIALEAAPTFTEHVMADLFVFFAAAAAVADAEHRRRRASRVETPATAGRLAALVLLGAVLAANLGEYAMHVEKRALGARPLRLLNGSLPCVVLAPILEAALLLPFFWVLPLLVTYVRAGNRRAELRPSLLAGLGYAVILVAALVAFTGGGRF
jgi:hypothetical protein